MFNKAAKFKMLPPGRPARSAIAPANDNRRNARPCAAQRNRTPRLVCRWSLSPDTGRPICRWELDTAGEPSPRLRGLGTCAPRIQGRLLVAYGKADAGQQIV
jgi:hypothetical protein